MHDLASGRIAAIWNAFSGRGVGLGIAHRGWPRGHR
ncbi:hypothetical protein Q1M63_28450 [Sinorhizobium meliloti]|nr:hypothetical protein Q1M63_28450 [Sinorhizobium meliloti]